MHAKKVEHHLEYKKVSASAQVIGTDKSAFMTFLLQTLGDSISVFFTESSLFETITPL